MSLACAGPHPAAAFNLYDGAAAGNNLEVNLTTTVSYTGFERVNSPSAFLEGPSNANGNDGDTNFQHGLVGNVFSALPILDIRDGDFGAHFSGQFYLDPSYLGTNQNGQPGTLNAIYVAKHTDFTSATRNVNGENAQLLDAFVVGSHTFADGQNVQLKVGRQTLFWGQSLLFPENGISAGQAPTNVVTAQELVNPQAQQVYMPVGQAVLTYQPGEYGLTFQGYYQFEWEHDFFQGAGAYFNAADYLDKGGQSLIVGAIPGLGNAYFLRNKDLDPEHQNGQFGVSVQAPAGAFDLGLFGLRFDAKAPELYSYVDQGAGRFVPGGIAAGNYQVVYPRDIWIEGASFSTYLGAANVAGEVSGRENMPLIPNASGGVILPGGNPGNANSDPLYPVGDMINAQVSTIYVSNGVPFDPGGISYTGELAANHLVSVTRNRSFLAYGRQATAAAFHVIISPQYYDVLPSLNISLPIGIEYNILGRSESDASMQHGTGTFNVGVSASYRVTWSATLTYQDYLGKADPDFNATADRGYVSLNLQHSF